MTATRDKYTARFAGRLWVLAVCCFLTACSHEPPRRTSQNDPYQVFGKTYTPITDSAGFVEAGIASWYGKDFHGKKTSSGEVYDMHGMTAAHKLLPLGTRVMVVNPANGRSVIVRVNDRGPFVDGRVIDLSFAAATQLGIAGGGTGRVVVVALDAAYQEPRPVRRTVFSVQVGAFSDRENAEDLKAALTRTYPDVFITPLQDGSRTLYRVRVGSYERREDGERALGRLTRDGYDNIKLVAE